jgi:hypothetical protein
MFCIISFVKKRKRKRSYYLGRPVHISSQWSIFRGDQLTHSQWSIFTGDLPTHAHTGLFSRATCPHTLTLIYFQGRPAQVEKGNSGLTVLGDLPKRKNDLIIMGDLSR